MSRLHFQLAIGFKARIHTRFMPLTACISIRSAPQAARRASSGRLQIELLYICGYVSGLIVGTIVGSLSDI